MHSSSALPSVLAMWTDWLPGQAWPVLAAPHNFYFWFGLLCCSVRSEGQSADEGHLWAISNQQAQPSNQGNNGTPSVTELLPQFYSSLAFTTTPELVRPVPVHRWLLPGRCVYHIHTIYVRITLHIVPVPVYTFSVEGQPSRGVTTLIIKSRQEQHCTVASPG